MKQQWIIHGYYWDGKDSWTLFIAADGSGKTMRKKR